VRAVSIDEVLAKLEAQTLHLDQLERAQRSPTSATSTGLSNSKCSDPTRRKHCLFVGDMRAGCMHRGIVNAEIGGS
jgi:hypothetical protein